MGFLNECFDIVMVINVHDRADRLQHFHEMSRAHDLEYIVVPGYDRDDLRREGYMEYLEEKDLFPGRLGCHLSHARAMFHACIKRKRALIFEDDAKLASPDAVERYLTDMPEECEMIFLGCGLEKPEQRTKNGDWYVLRPGGWWGMWAYGFTTLEAQHTVCERMQHVRCGYYQDTALRTMGTGVVTMRGVKQVCSQNMSFGSDTKEVEYGARND